MSEQALGRVLPRFRGNYENNVVYNRLDVVLFENDGCSWVCTRENVQNIQPGNNGFWQKLAQKGNQGIQGLTGGFGTPNVNTTTLTAGASATVAIAWDGISPAEEKVFNFEFGIPAGPTGFEDVTASAIGLEAGLQPTATASLIKEDEQSITTLSFLFGIPLPSGTGVQRVDGIGPTTDSEGYNNVILDAVSYGTDQALGPSYKAIALSNIGAQPSGDYLIATGDAMEGTLSIKSANLVDGNIPSYDQTGEEVNFTDANDEVISYIRNVFNTTGNQSLEIGVVRTINDENYNNSIFLSVDGSGNPNITLSNNSIWRNAMGLTASDTTPNVDSEDGTPGEEQSYSRADHVHPLNAALSGSPGADIQDGALGSADTYARSDHRHSLNVALSGLPGVDMQGGTLGSTNTYARSDHRHPLNTTNTNPIKDAGTNGSAGASSYYARSDHYHPLNVSDEDPVRDGIAAHGNASTYARSDHRHPSDTFINGLVVNMASNVFASESALPSDNHIAGRIAFIPVTPVS